MLRTCHNQIYYDGMNAKDKKGGLHSTLGITIYLNSTFDKFDIDEFPTRMKKGFLLHFSASLINGNVIISYTI